MNRALLEELLAREGEDSLIQLLSGIDGALDELFETGSITLDLLLTTGPAKVVLSLQAEIG